MKNSEIRIVTVSLPNFSSNPTNRFILRKYPVRDKITIKLSICSHKSHILAMLRGLLSKKQYSTSTETKLTRKLLTDLCLECSSCALFFSRPLSVSIISLFLNIIPKIFLSLNILSSQMKYSLFFV